MKKLLSILFCLTITLFIYSQEVTVSGGHSVQENKTTKVNTSSTEYLCNTPAELTVDKPVKLSIGGNDAWSFTINPTGGTQYWDVKDFDSKKYIGALLLTIPSALGIVFGITPFMFEEPYKLWNGAAALGGIGCFTWAMILTKQSSYKVTLVKIEY